MVTITPLRALLTSCLPATLFLKSRPISSILALAARFLALSVKLFNIIWNGREIIIYHLVDDSHQIVDIQNIEKKIFNRNPSIELINTPALVWLINNLEGNIRNANA